MDLFPLGRVLVTPGAQEVVSGDELAVMLSRHAKGDWGEVPEDDKQENEQSLLNGWRLLSAYTADNGEKIWLITEADRSATTILLPSEY